MNVTAVLLAMAGASARWYCCTGDGSGGGTPNSDAIFDRRGDLDRPRLLPDLQQPDVMVLADWDGPGVP